MKIEIETKFNIGDKVYMKSDLMNWDGKSDTYGKPAPTAIPIVGITPEVCYGGIQVHYFVRFFGSKPGLHRISGIELHDKLEAL